MIKYVFHKRYDTYGTSDYNQIPLDALICLLTDEMGISYRWWIEMLEDPKSPGMGGNIVELEKEGDTAYIYFSFDENGRKDAFVIKVADLIPVLKEWVKIKKENWDIITIKYDQGKFSFKGSMHPKERTIIFYRGLEDDDPTFYNTIGPVHGIIGELRLFLVHELQKNPDPWIKFLKNPSPGYRDSDGACLEKFDNDLVFISNFSHKVRTEQDIEAFAIKRTDLLDLAQQWIKLTSTGYPKIILEVNGDSSYKLNGQL